ncbi:RHS repeat domain-containing protein [Hymenobacter sp. ASUV-10]|uniref:RHS repeat domain-containing protein n=1 Tax=Hymenobacter aranciens TaxID=3063996 RepID=A0ABT9BA35_9BACT|nr:RHS repeat domain-containing protein [Hymenobacter sp. ASUV-10]MDO7875131.1 RHS repeat domain-containing protein [Hymenobacter sp. ASUV-10]
MNHFYTNFRFGSLLLLFFTTISAFGQTSNSALSRFDRRMVPPSPEATQIGVFGNVTPDLNSGAVQLNVPLPAAKGRQLTLPLSLNYHYTGLQVSELPSWVGLGWTLSCGGVITRSVQGLPDEQQNKGYTSGGWQQLRLLRNKPIGSLTVHVTGNQQAVAPDLPLKALCQRVLRNELDTEPDSYTISTPFYSGKLLVDSLGRLTCSPHADVTVTRASAGGWVIRTGDGTQYVYNVAEITSPSDDLGTSYGQVATAWYLSEIVSADNSDRITLVYGMQPSGPAVPVNSVVKQVLLRNRLNSPCDSRQPSYLSVPDVGVGSWPVTVTTTTSPYLTAILTPTIEVEFISDTARRDVAVNGDRTVRRLTRIVYREPASLVAKSDFVLTQSYFNGTSSNRKARRFRLDAVQEIGKPSYRFQYYGDGGAMPSRDSFAKDHWGYYNGSIQNTGLLPSIPPYLLALYGAATNTYSGNSRAAQGQMSQIGALRQVQYPTGGRTTFDYEPNTITKARTAPTLASLFGEPFTMQCLPVTAQVTGGSVTMNATALRYRAEHGGSPDGTTLLSNVQAEVIEAPHGFYLCDLRWDGEACRYNGGSQTVARGNIRTSLWRAEYDSLSATYRATTQICAVNYTVGNQCHTVMTPTGGSYTNQTYPPGNYLVVAEVSASSSALFWASMTTSIFKLPDPNPPSSSGNPSTSVITSQVGGIRLRQTTDQTAAGEANTKIYRYCPAGQPDRSSGQLFFFPEYSYQNACGDLIVGASDVGKENWLESGYHVGYERVEIESKGRQAGTVVYQYYNAKQPANARSLVTKVEELNQQGSAVKETQNTYQVVPTSTTPGFRLYQHYDAIGSLIGTDGISQRFIVDAFFWLTPHDYAAYWPQLTASTERISGTGGSATLGLPSRTVHHYLPKAPGRTTQPVRTARYLSDGRQLITKTLYCGQYNITGQSLIGPALGVNYLATKHMISVPIEHQAWQRLGADSSVVGGDLTHFVQGRPHRILALATTAPIPARQFLSSHIQNNELLQDARYIERVAFPRYNAAGNPLEQQVTAATPSSYLWGYNETHLVAEVKGAAYKQVAYTSFEDGGMGSFVYDPATGPGRCRVPGGRTGNWAYRLGGGSVSRDSLPAGNYELVLWAQSAQPPSVPGSRISTPAPEEIATAPGGWHQFRWRIACQADASFAISVWSNEPPMLIDEVRLYPVGAHMTSYTYDPVVGMTSQTDPAGRTATYEYDALGRLLRVRDEQNRIQAQQEYHYARP